MVPIAELKAADQYSGFQHHHEKSGLTAPREVRPVARVEKLRERPAVLPFQRDPNNLYDIRHIFSAYSGHGH